MKCSFEKKIYESQENGYCVYLFSTKEAIPNEAIVENNTHKVLFKGCGYFLSKGNDLELSGTWEKGKYGFQFSIDSCEEILPKTKEEIFNYLSSGLIKGIGSKIARKIVDTFEEDALEIIANEPKRLLMITGITEKMLDSIQFTFQKSRSIRELVGVLAPFGITPAKVRKIDNKFGSKSMMILKECPFKLCEIQGFGFKTVDTIANQMHWGKMDATVRIEAAVKYVLETAASTEGHLYLPALQLLNQVHLELKMTVKIERIKEVIRDMAGFSRVVAENNNIFLPFRYDQENNIARTIAKMLIQPPERIRFLEEYLQLAQTELKITLSHSQNEAVKKSLNNYCSIISGGPGTGKTTVLKILLYVFDKTIKGNVLLLAPTGKASRKMAESTGKQASTIHSALYLPYEEDYQDVECNELSYDLVVVDETSMMDSYIANELLKRMNESTRIVFVGDIDQLPSVGAGNVFREMIESNLIPTTYLNTIYRQSEDSIIPINANKINIGQYDLNYGNDFLFIEAKDELEAVEKIKMVYQDELQKHGLDAVQVLTPYRKKRVSSSEKLNLVLRDLIHLKDENQEIKIGSSTFRIGDKVMQTKNREGICNGDIGTVTEINKQEMKIVVTFSYGEKAEYHSDRIHLLELAYCTTVHKSQGSEYDVVIIPVLNSYGKMLQRNLYYTGITRSKLKVILIGQKTALYMAIQNNKIVQRNTMLGSKIIKYYKSFTVKSAKEEKTVEEEKQIKLNEAI